jgi:hypothetical protein
VVNSLAARQTGHKFSGDLSDAQVRGRETRYGDLAAMIATEKAPPMLLSEAQFASDAPEPIELPTLPGGMATQPVNPATGEAPELEQPLVSTAALEEGMMREPRTGSELAADIGKEPATDVATSADLVSLPKKGRIVVPGMEQQELHDPHTGPE